MQIYCSTCTPEQMDVLKNSAIIPISASQCGLITRSDAERLVSMLLDRNPPLASLSGFRAKVMKQNLIHLKSISQHLNHSYYYSWQHFIWFFTVFTIFIPSGAFLFWRCAWNRFTRSLHKRYSTLHRGNISEISALQ